MPRRGRAFCLFDGVLAFPPPPPNPPCENKKEKGLLTVGRHAARKMSVLYFATQRDRVRIMPYTTHVR